MKLLLSAGMLVLIVAGCSLPSINSVYVKDVQSITLVCIQSCLDMENKPFTEKRYEDAKSMKLFIKAINRAEKMEGILDYSAIFLMKLAFKDGTVRQYHFNIADTPNPQQGLLLKLPDTNQGYTIPQQLSSDLKQLIYD